MAAARKTPSADEIRAFAAEAGMSLLRGVLRTGARAAAAAYDTVLEDVEKVLEGNAETIKQRRSRVKKTASRMSED